MVYAITKVVLWPFLKLFIKQIDGAENLPDKPFIMVGNHESYIDGVILMMMVAWHKNRQLCYFATNQKFLGAFWNMIFNHFGAIRVNGSLQKGLNALNRGKCIGLFPEGGRTYTCEMQKVEHKGLGVLALSSQAPVVPVGIFTYKFWNRYQKLPTFRKNIKITIGTPMTFKGKITTQSAWKVVKAVMKEVARLARISHA